MWQQWDDGVAQTFTQWTQEFSVLYVVAGVTSQTLLTALLLHLHGLKVPETAVAIRLPALADDWVMCGCKD